MNNLMITLGMGPAGRRRIQGNWIRLLVLVVGLSGLAGRADAAAPLPFVEKFNCFLKGSWRVTDGQGTWSSGPIAIAGEDEIVVSFDANRKGHVLDRESNALEANYLKVWYELDGVPAAEPLLNETGSFNGRVVKRVIKGSHQTITVKVEASSVDSGLQYFVDNVRVTTGAAAGIVTPSDRVKSMTPLPVLPPAPKASGVRRYARLPGHEESRTFALKVNGVELPVEQMWGDPAMVIDPTAQDFKVSVARFAFDFQATPFAEFQIVVGESIDAYEISPRNPAAFGRFEKPFHTHHELAERSLSFRLDQPRHLMVKINDLEYLVIVVDAPEVNPPRPGDEEVVSLADYFSANRDHGADVTAVVQRAINETAAARKILYVPAGLYRTGQLALGNDAQVYLSDGALLRAISDWNPTLWPPQAGANVTNKDSAFIFVGTPATATADPGATAVANVHLWGRGVIDGNGWNIRSRNDSSLTTANVKLFRSARAKNVVVEDVYFRDSARWAFNILLSEQVRFTNVKLVNCMIGFRGNWANDQYFKPDVDPSALFHIPLITNLDAYDIDASTNVVVEDGLVFTGDDAFTPKVTGYLGLVAPTANIVIRRNLIWTEKVALKMGPETHADMSNVLFTDNHVVRCDRFFAGLVQGKPGIAISNMRVIDNRVEYLGGNFYERFVRLIMFHEGSLGAVLIDGLDSLSDAPQFSSSEGFDAANRIGPVTIRNVRVRGDPLGKAELFGPSPLLKHSSVKVEATPTIEPEPPPRNP